MSGLNDIEPEDEVDHHGGRRTRLPRVQRPLEEQADRRGRLLHRDADTQHRGAGVPAGPQRRAVSARHSDLPGVGPGAAHHQPRRGPRGVRLLRRLARVRDAPGGTGQRRRRRILPPGGRPGHDRQPQARHRGVRGAHGMRQEPDHPARGRDPSGCRPPGRRRAASDALWRPDQADMPAVRQAGGPRSSRLHNRGARRV